MWVWTLNIRKTINTSGALVNVICKVINIQMGISIYWNWQREFKYISSTCTNIFHLYSDIQFANLIPFSINQTHHSVLWKLSGNIEENYSLSISWKTIRIAITSTSLISTSFALITHNFCSLIKSTMLFFFIFCSLKSSSFKVVSLPKSSIIIQ